MRRCTPWWLLFTLVALLPLACADDSPAGEGEEEFGDNPFLADDGEAGKADTQYQNPDGIEVEVDLEADVEASAWALREAPAMLGQFALTYLRKRGEFYLESLAEDSTSDERVEWLVDGEWKTAQEVTGLGNDKLNHFRLRGVNAVLLAGEARRVSEGKVYTAKVPVNPGTLMQEVGDKCADPDSHMTLSQSIYWYQWNPDKSGCTAKVQEMTVTVAKLLPSAKVTYPEYDQLLADGKVTAVVLFGKIGEGDIETDTGMRGFKQMARWLLDAGFTEVTPAPVGRRFTKHIGDYDFEIDLYSPKDFSGLDDYAHFDNFQRAIGEHEILAYDGHSMLGASDYWSRPTYPAGYQIFLYGGCLGYEYYLRPILAGKGGWDKVDILSSVIEVSAGANEFAAPALAKIAYALDHKLDVSWKDILVAVRRGVGDSTFGMSGVRENCFSPNGSLCGPEPAGEERVEQYVDETVTAIPDDDPAGIARTLEVPDDLKASTVTVALSVTHTYAGDLLITLTHDGVTATVWDKARASGSGFEHQVTLPDFSGRSAKGLWTLKVVDTAALDAGQLNSWSLTVTAP
ncbi:MAG: proprotein convertase P-domain-containing protein [Myxococcota bacterium]|jgi:hypothetical protein|nr:proprotein convertase P-domain-containing protein [Myxococcota bacterium]